jgi:flagellar biosynthesis protein FlhG
VSDQATQLRKAIEQADEVRVPRGVDEVITHRRVHDVAEVESNTVGAPMRRSPLRMNGGVVSVGPSAAAAHSAAHSPQRATRSQHVSQHPVKLARAIAVCSGKGGVGKSNLAVNLAVVLSQMDLKVCLLDADLGTANADVLCSLSPRRTIEHVVNGQCRLWEAMMLAPGGFRLIPGASGVANLADLGAAPRRSLLQQLAALERIADVILIDTGAGISLNVMSFAAAAHTAVVVTTPEPTAVTDAYALIKTLHARAPASNVELVVNMTGRRDEAERVFGRMDRVCRTFLNRPLTYAGSVPRDRAVLEAVRQRMPFTLLSPDSAATVATRGLARRLIGYDEPTTPDAEQAAPKHGFVARLMGLFSPHERNRE